MLKGVEKLLETRQEVGWHLTATVSLKVGFWVFEKDLGGPSLPVDYWGSLQYRPSASSEHWSFVGQMKNELLHGLCDAVLSLVDHWLESLVLGHRQHFH